MDDARQLTNQVYVPKTHLVPAYKGYDRPTADGAVFQVIQAAVEGQGVELLQSWVQTRAPSSG